MEVLDSELFRCSGLVDYRITSGDTFQIEALTLDGLEGSLSAILSKLIPEKNFRLLISKASPRHRPMYPGKRFLLPEIPR